MKVYSYTRFSTPEQLKGDSLRRQTDEAQAYCQRHGLILDESLTFRDLGISAFHGLHRQKGELGDFLKLVESGTIPKGSILLVENLDRLSRQEPITALFQLQLIVSAGIRVVTLTDQKVYSTENLKDLAILLTSIISMSRAYEESKTKQDRGKKAWINKRNLAIEKGIPLTKVAPLWLKYDEVEGKFVPIPERVAVINQIYEMRLNGFGADAICKHLNKLDVWKPPIESHNKTGGWRKGYVQKILKTRAVIGEFIPGKRDDETNKQIKACDPIQNYYPSVVDVDVFNSVQAINQQAAKLPGRAGGHVGIAKNLFVYIGHCGICGGKLHLIDHYHYTYLQCDVARRKSELNGVKCTAKSMKYHEVEKIIFEDLEEINVSDILPDNSVKTSQIAILEQRRTSLEYLIPEYDRKMDNITDSMSNENNPKLRQALKDKWSKLDFEQTELTKERASIEQQLSELRSNGKSLQEKIDNIKEVFHLLYSTDDENKAIEIRLKLRQAIRKVVDRIEIYPLDRKFKEWEQAIDEPGIMVHTRSKSIRKIRIRFKESKKLRVLFLQHKINPADFE